MTWARVNVRPLKDSRHVSTPPGSPREENLACQTWPQCHLVVDFSITSWYKSVANFIICVFYLQEGKQEETVQGWFYIHCLA